MQVWKNISFKKALINDLSRLDFILHKKIAIFFLAQ